MTSSTLILQRLHNFVKQERVWILRTRSEINQIFEAQLKRIDEFELELAKLQETPILPSTVVSEDISNGPST